MAVTSTRSIQTTETFPGVFNNPGDQSGTDFIFQAEKPGALVWATGDGVDRRLVISLDGGETTTDLGLGLALDHQLIGDPNIIQLQDGRIVISYAGIVGDAADIYAIIYDPATGTASATYVPATVSDGTDPEIAALDGGNWVAVFEHTPSNTVRFQLMNGDGQIGSEITLSSNSGFDPTVTALAGGGFIVTWTENNGGDFDVMGAIYDDEGNVVKSAFNMSEISNNAALFDDQSQSAVLALPDGGFIVAMTDADASDSQIFLQRYDSTGNVSSLFDLTSSQGIVAGDPEIALLPNGEFLVTWTSLKGGGDTEIRAAIVAIDQNGGLQLVPVSVDGHATATNFTLADLAGDDVDASLGIDERGILVSLFTAASDGDGTAVGAYHGQIYTNHVGDGADDALIGDGLLDYAVMGGGADTVVGLGGNDQLYGEGGEDTLLGGSGNDLIEGGIGADMLIGGVGSDTLMYSNSAAGVTINLTTSTASGGEATGDEIAGFENVIGTDAVDNLTGNSAVNRLEGGAGADTLVAVGNGDTLVGGAGGDTYTLGSFTAIVEDDGLVSEKDTVTSTMTRSLATLGFVNIENLTLLGTAVGGTGNARDNVITGNNAANTLLGMDGKDTIIGGIGKDTMTGGNQDDLFKFTLKTHSSANHASADVIMDFDDVGKGNDKIDLAGIYGPKLSFINTGAFTNVGQVRVNDIAGADVIIEVNLSGGLEADFAIRLKNTTLSQIGLDDFVL